MEQIGSPETPVSNYLTQRNNPEDRRIYPSDFTFKIVCGDNILVWLGSVIPQFTLITA